MPLYDGDLLPLGVSEVQLQLWQSAFGRSGQSLGPQFTSRILFKVNKTLNCQAALRPLLSRYVFGTFSNQINWKSTQTWITKLSIHHWIMCLYYYIICLNRPQTRAAQGQLECTSDTVISVSICTASYRRWTNACISWSWVFCGRVPLCIFPSCVLFTAFLMAFTLITRHCSAHKWFLNMVRSCVASVIMKPTTHIRGGNDGGQGVRTWMEISLGRGFSSNVCLWNSHGNMLGRRCQPLQKGIAVKGGTARLGFFAKCQPNIVTTEGSESRQAPMNRFGMEMTSAGFLVVSLASHFPHHSYSFHVARCGVWGA